MYPTLLKPTDIEVFEIDHQKIEIPKCLIQFNRCDGKSIENTFGGKPLVCLNGKPMFAELAIKEYFVISGWKSRWIETYGRGSKEPLHLSNWIDDKYSNQVEDRITDERVLRVLADIASNNNLYSGCWDVVGWNSDNIIFAEAKRLGKDSIRNTQIKWLEAGLREGLKPENFLVVQWDFLSNLPIK